MLQTYICHIYDNIYIYGSTSIRIPGEHPARHRDKVGRPNRSQAEQKR